ncbi:MAG: type II toxin-antitoxin system RelE/ParE family toxin [Desulfobacteraceae bacterium]|nr:type II toxin-antitoxin system RelE/ParE family toxin [Desulfobacteraceae bacterium]
MNVIFNESARDEFNDAVAYYELKVSGLGQRFRKEVKKSIKRITEYPEVWSKEKDDVRKYLLHKFPYKILYSIESDHIYIIAIAHQHRRPNYWADRLGEM